MAGECWQLRTPRWGVVGIRHFPVVTRQLKFPPGLKPRPDPGQPQTPHRVTEIDRKLASDEQDSH
jgi:hypothetical protein